MIAADKFPTGSPFYHLSTSIDTRDFPDIGEFAIQTALFMLNFFHVQAELTRGGKSGNVRVELCRVPFPEQVRRGRV
jgi:hypothetical protein